MSTDRCHRLWRQAGLQVPRRRRRRRVSSTLPRPLPAHGRNHVWAYDFVFDACANGQQRKCLTVVDEYTRECLAIDVAGSIRSPRVIEVLARLVSVHGAPAYLRCDNGPEFVSRAILEWLVDAGINTAHIEPDVPPPLSSTAIWSPIPNDKEIGREEAFYRRADHRLPA